MKNIFLDGCVTNVSRSTRPKVGKISADLLLLLEHPSEIIWIKTFFLHH